ncbi:MAG: 50S ribosomal protein L10 [Bacteroidota bacterium]|nr:50S ribosomal protein L10 [Bacteroidota bacterium]
MTREQKNKLIESLTEEINSSDHLYLVDYLGLNAQETNDLRRDCFKNNVKFTVTKNTLLKVAMEKSDKELQEFDNILKNSTAVMFSAVGNLPGKILKDYRKKHELPLLKGALVEEDFYFGDESIEQLAAIKSKNELIADVISALQAPANNVISALQTGGNTIMGVLETLEEKAE